jgi:hypothetical protein
MPERSLSLISAWLDAQRRSAISDLTHITGGCGECEEHALASPHLVGACSSVGIEHGKSTGQMMAEYLRSFHGRGHTPLAGGDAS